MKSKKKRTREKGKVKISMMFQKLVTGDKVCVVRELSQKTGFPFRIQGKTGVIDSKRGSAYIVKIKDLNKEKKYIINPVHLKKLK